MPLKVLFVLLDFYMEGRRPHNGLAALSASLKAAGHRTALCHVWLSDHNRLRGMISSKVASFKPDVVAFSCTEVEHRLLSDAARFVREEFPHIPVVVGGAYATLAPEEVLAATGAHCVFVGEADVSFPEFLRRMEEAGRPPADVRGTCAIRNGKLARIPPARLPDPCTLPEPDLSLFDKSSVVFDASRGGMSRRSIYFVAKRGCPFQYTYCVNKHAAALHDRSGSYLRSLEVGRVIGEIRRLKERYSFNEIVFNDEVFTGDREWLREFSAAYRREIAIPFFASSRVESVDSEAVSLLSGSGCKCLDMGIESGNEWIRRNV